VAFALPHRLFTFWNNDWNRPFSVPSEESTTLTRNTCHMASSPMAKYDRGSLKSLRHLVIKIGSGVLAPDGALDPSTLAQLAAQIATVRASGARVTLVSSGAVASGYRLLGFAKPPTSIVHKQCSAAIGQPRLMAAWEAAFAPHGITVAQTLYTSDDLATRRRYLNTRRTLGELLARNILPIVNENDTTSYDEIKLGDNDRLSALTADLVDRARAL
jgi:glutamate 5-kinase